MYIVLDVHLPVNGVVLHFLEVRLGNDGGCEGVVSYLDSLPLDLTKTLGAVHIPEKKKG